ncbi:FHA domain-containing protein [Sphaerisporangium sp. TRM90804]|uniref:FHA domain-containing protein n=1 Tax=Sphaerisporangium sp. TRM90804 TaxID=3031113 RepID=UPI002447613C|nr:FHA domain-containing protein [Sphaerisporangium sp. TRM90804]MDH2426291.1 FHA domain-containing protein [Sphaerisporangium sp. TRM90804]
MATCPAGHDSADEEYCDVCGALMTGAPGQAAPAPPASSGAPRGEGPCPDCGAPRGGRFCESCGYDFVLGGSSQAFAPPPSRPAADPGAPAQPAQPAQAWRPAQIVRPGSSQPRPDPAGPAPTQGRHEGAPHSQGWHEGAGPQSGRPQTTGDPGSRGGPAGSGWLAVVAADRGHYEAMIALGGPDAARVAFPPYCPERRIPLAGREMRIGRRSRTRSLEPEIDLSGPPEDPGVSHLHAVLLAEPDGGWRLVDPGSANGTLLNGKSVEVNVPVPVGDGDRVNVGAWTVITLRRG